MASTITSSGKIPSYVEAPIKGALGKIEKWAYSDDNKVWGEDGQNPVAGFSGLQEDAIANTGWLADQDLGQLFGYDDAGEIFRSVADSGPSYIGEDAEGYSVLGGEAGVNDIAAYMNPYLQSVLNPTLRENEETFKRANNDIGHAAQASGAFGDARHGIAEGESVEKFLQQNSDSTAGIYDAGYNQAVTAKTGDVNRLMSADMANQSAAEAYYNRLMNSGAAIAQTGQQDFDNYVKTNDMLFNAGQLEQNQNQNQINADQAVFEALNNKDYNAAMAVMSAAGGTPYSTSTTQTQTSDSGKSGIFGSIAGSVASTLLSSLFA